MFFLKPEEISRFECSLLVYLQLVPVRASPVPSVVRE